MKIQITENDTSYNRDGTPGGKRTANKGDIVSVPFPVGKTLIDLNKAKEVSSKPKPKNKVVTPNEAKQEATYTLEDRGSGWWAIIDEDGDAVDKIRSEEKAKAKLEELNE